MHELGGFDVIVVGAGSAGCALAGRLSEDPACRVLLLEAGPRDRSPWVHVPGGYYRLLNHPVLSWNFRAGPEPGLDGREMIWPRGRVLGGSSAINGMVYVRGQKQDYDTWRQRGCAGWGWDEVLPYFRRAEDQTRGADHWHGVGGPIPVSDIGERHELSEAFIAAARAWGAPLNPDFNGAAQEGVGTYQLTARRRRRGTAARYLRANRANLHVLTGARAVGIVLAGSRAIGVRVLHHGRETLARATSEIVLAAGAVQSPHLLLLSGIGPHDALAAAGVPVRHALPGVGQDLQDHLQVKLTYRVDGVRTLNEIRSSRWRMAREGLRFALAASGPLANGTMMAGGFVRSDPALEAPDVQLHFQPISGPAPGVFHDHPGCTLTVSQLRPESRGEIRLRSSDPLEAPLMRAGYLTARRDREVVVAALRLGQEIMRQDPLRPYRPQAILPDPEQDGDAPLLGHARRTGFTQFHLVGGCRMGIDPGAVVDPCLRVRGLDGLRVADASIMPSMVSGNTNAAAIMIGEKAADLLRGRTLVAAA